MSIDVNTAFDAGQTLAVADRILISPQAGSLQSRVDELLDAIENSGASGDLICKTLIQLGMNFVGRDAEIVGYGAEEIDAALDSVLDALDDLEADQARSVVGGFLADMKSVNLADSLSGLLAERIESNLDAGQSRTVIFGTAQDQHARRCVLANDR